MKALLVSSEVQGIRFAFGSIPVWPGGIRAVADVISAIPTLPGLTVWFDPLRFIEMAKEGRRVLAEYNASEDRIYLPSYRYLEHPALQGHVVHEAVHALCDLRARSTALRSEEGAAELAQAWYYLATGQEQDALAQSAVSQDVFDVASAVRGRAAKTSGMVPLKGSEINAVRAAIVSSEYPMAHNTNRDGIAGHRL